MINNFCELLAEIMRYGDTADGSIGLLPEGIVVVYCQDTVEMAASGNHGIHYVSYPMLFFIFLPVF